MSILQSTPPPVIAMTILTRTADISAVNVITAHAAEAFMWVIL